VPLDIALAALPYEERVMSRSSLFAFRSDYVITTCSAEDLVVLKAARKTGSTSKASLCASEVPWTVLWSVASYGSCST
jgi:hypothetical protein